MIDVKMSVSFTIPGRVMYTKEESLKNSHVEKLTFTTGKGKDSHKETITYEVRDCKPAIFRMNVSAQQYKLMLDDYAPQGYKPKEWKRLSNKKKIEAYLNNIKTDIGARDFTYEIFAD